MLDLMKGGDSREKAEKIAKTNIPENSASVLGLIAKCESLVVELRNSGDDDIMNEILLLLAKLKMMLFYLFKKKRQKLLNMHWEEIIKENEHYAKKMQEALDKKRKILNNQSVITKK